MKRSLLFILLCSLFTFAFSKENTVVVFPNEVHQTIHSFGASDCWRTQYIGKNWPLEKRNAIADYLFSTDFDDKGNPRGIGLTLWRFNIGSGSHEAGERGGVASEWRRTECFLDSLGNWDWSKQEGQRWFLQAARARKVPYTLGFSISAPVFMSKNGMARASEPTPYANLRPDKYVDYAHYMAVVCEKLGLDYLSPINEPQWNWIHAGQEGMQMTNEECCRLIRCLDKELKKINGNTRVVFGEAGCINYLYERVKDNPLRSNQIEEIFATDGKYSISGLQNVAPIVSGHSYWSTWSLDSLISWRKRLDRKIKTDLPGTAYWQTEYCPMEKNDDNPYGGGKRDIGMNTALYVARVIHSDLVYANAASWQFWTAFSEWDYKDGLIYIDDGKSPQGANSLDNPLVESCKYDGVYRTSKLMWALGNYSLFVRPGMQRISVNLQGVSDEESVRSLMVSAYKDPISGKMVLVFINFAQDENIVNIQFKGNKKVASVKYKQYITSEECDLSYKGNVGNKVVIPARSLVTLVSEMK